MTAICMPAMRGLLAAMGISPYTSSRNDLLACLSYGGIEWFMKLSAT